MNTEVKKKWVDALRSGAYKQGKNLLKSKIDGNECFCVLGVLCDIWVKEEGEKLKIGWTKNPSYADGRENIRCNFALMPTEVEKWAKFTSEELGCEFSPRVEVNGRKRTVTNLNDFDAYDFNRLADLIESQL